MTHNNSYSPRYGAGPAYYTEFATPSPTPSPRNNFYHEPPAAPPARPHTRAAHGRHASTGFNAEFSSPRQPNLSSPRYNSSGHYATANVSEMRSSRRPSGSGPRPKRERRYSYSFYRASDSHGESDEDELIEINGITYVLPARSKSMRFNDWHHHHHHSHNARGYNTNSYSYAQAGPGGYTAAFDRTPAFVEPPQFAPPRRSSFSVPQRSHTARPQSSHQKKTAPPPQPPPSKKATPADAKKHRIPTGYSLKNWDPTEEPILLLGSVFDANSLGKWIYDWVCHVHGSGSPLSDMAGELWLLLIRLSGNVREAEDILPKVRDMEKKEILDDFIESGDRLMDRLCKLLATCEKFMLKASKKRTGDGRALGIEFVGTLFGRDRELDETEKFMSSLKLWEHRFRTNCQEILQQPTK